MSFTLTSTPQKSGKLYLSPSKKRRLSKDNETPQASTTKEIHSWTFSADSVASCTVGDVLTMKPSLDDSYDFFWLGRIPCRSVKIVGIVVGIQVYEQKIVYTVDDGTGVIDCHHRPLVSPSKPKAPLKYERPAEAPVVKPLKPVARLGSTVRLVGNVRPLHETRVIHVTASIEACKSQNEELHHSRAVRKLHQNWYSLGEPFIVPRAPTTVNVTSVRPTAPTIPFMQHTSTPSSVTTSPQKSSPIKDMDGLLARSPPRLRHPSRLHTHDLTENTFRIYVKHYMDHAPPFSPESHADLEFQRSVDALPTTPTKRPRSTSDGAETPRPTRSQPIPDRTPKAGLFISKFTTSSSSPVSDSEAQWHGFTLSYLKRVPELSLLAARVVQAVTKRRLRDEHKRLKQAGVITSTSKSTSSTLPSINLLPEKIAPKMKRLFQWAVVQLLKEGCIVLWDGPVRRCPESSGFLGDASRLWKSHSSGTSLLGDNSIFSANTTSNTTGNTTATLSFDLEDPSGYLSDPQPNEESYIPLSPVYLAPYVEKAIKVLVDHYEKNGKPYHGATKDGILSVLRKDDRWRYVGDWSVDDALEVLKSEGKVWRLKPGRWDLTE
ncbi:hypothetical protein CPB83DRAFT_906660 [Crepidotus variabilis]|uniref:CST complex subunit STN1 n=1 Tax=Crepidotus variabilis TaxID=179855 RepID=A0A9P6JQ94_9AGAR|nr:hypothetical protein CPB83DRAFT_906660 [Crepidotus variabilis]